MNTNTQSLETVHTHTHTHTHTRINLIDKKRVDNIYSKKHVLKKDFYLARKIWLNKGLFMLSGSDFHGKSFIMRVL